ncbi:MAG: class I SAM-dependent methyltransferase [Patescibacteria group bacterium]|nr:class I SAM-dependent methyltransferase [Patescibacteria group bacterium]
MEGFLNPIEILNQLELKEDMIAADFGCGSGGWVLPLAKKLEEGKIYAIDILEEPLSALRARTKLEKISNIETIKADVERGTPLASNSIDLVLMTNLLFECEDKKMVLEEGKRVLKKEGKILIVDWIKDNPLTPKIEWVDFEEIKKIAEELNLKLKKEFSAGKYHQGLIFEK